MTEPDPEKLRDDMSWLTDVHGPLLMHEPGWREKQKQVLALPKYILRPTKEVLGLMRSIDDGTRKLDSFDEHEREAWRTHIASDIISFLHYHAVYRDRDDRKIKSGGLTAGQLVIAWRIAICWTRGVPIRLALLKYRRGGFSWLFSQIEEWVAEFHENRGASSIANDKETARAILRYCKDTHQRMPKWLRATTKYTSKNQLFFEETDKEKLDAGEYGMQSYIDVQSVGKDFVGTGSDIQVAHFSEAGKYDKICDPDEQFTSTTNTIPEQPGTMIILESTAHGAGTWWNGFWDECVLVGQRGWNLYTPIFIPWFFDARNTVPAPPGFTLHEDGEYGDEKKEAELHGLDNGQMAWRRIFITKQRGEDAFDVISRFRQEFPATPEEAWRNSTGRFISPTMFEQIRSRCLTNKTPLFIGDMTPKRELGESLKFTEWATPRSVGSLRVWEHPVAGADYVLGADVATGQAVDMSCLKVYRRQGTRLLRVAEWYGLILVDDFAHVMWRIGFYYNTALLAWERTGPGMNIAPFLRKGTTSAPNSPYPSNRMFRRPRVGHVKWTADGIYGVDMSWKTKRPMMSLFVKTASDGEIELGDEDLDELGAVSVLDNGRIETNGLDRLIACVTAVYGAWLVPAAIPDVDTERVRGVHGSVDWIDEVVDEGDRRKPEYDEEVLFQG